MLTTMSFVWNEAMSDGDRSAALPLDERALVVIHDALDELDLLGGGGGDDDEAAGAGSDSAGLDPSEPRPAPDAGLVMAALEAIARPE